MDRAEKIKKIQNILEEGSDCEYVRAELELNSRGKSYLVSTNYLADTIEGYRFLYEKGSQHTIRLSKFYPHFDKELLIYLADETICNIEVDAISGHREIRKIVFWSLCEEDEG